MLDALIWYAWMQAFALGGWLVAARWLRLLPDRGYAVGKALGLMLGAFAYWAAVTLGLSLNNAGAALLGLAAVWVLAIAWRAFDGRASDGPIRPWRADLPPPVVVVATEIIFALSFFGWSLVRAYSPDIMYVGGEKFMESMMTGAILRSPSFPPNDAWLSGFTISYYYFGYIVFAMLIHLSGVAPSIAFNLGGAMIFALAVTAAFGLGFSIFSLRSPASDARPPNHERKASGIAAGILTALMLALMGNLGGILGAAKCADALPAAVWQWLDVRETATRTYACEGLAPSEFYGWWWDWSRVVNDRSPAGSPQEVITESPIFSFVLGDNHPHVIALPFAMVALALALHALAGGRPGFPSGRDRPGEVLAFVVSAIVLGGLSFTNTWDFPVYGAIFLGALGLGRWLRREALLPALAYGMGVIALGYLLYLPWSVTFASQARGVGVNLFNGTRFPQFFAMFAPFLIAGAGFAWLMARSAQLPARRIAARAAGLTALVTLAGVLAVALFGLLSSETRALAQELSATGSAMGVTRAQVESGLVARAANPWTALALGAGAALSAVLLFAWPRAQRAGDASGPGAPQNPASLSDAFTLLLFGAGALLTLAVEFVFLRDLFGTRMNTVFKFYYQAWALWSVAAAYAIIRLLTSHQRGPAVAGGVALVFVALGLLWPAMAVPARSGGFAQAPTLDGAAYLARSDPEDAALIAWLNENVPGDARIVEASTLGAYEYAGRISAFTGLPTALGWGGHQHQWRGTFDEAARRHGIVEELYTTIDPAAARAILDEFGARYVVVGGVERGRFPAEGLAKFESFCGVAFQSGNSTIYRCDRR